MVVAAEGDEHAADELHETSVAAFAFNKATIRLTASGAVPENLPPALAETIPNLPQLKGGKSFAVLCSGSTCKPPIFTVVALQAALGIPAPTSTKP